MSVNLNSTFSEIHNLVMSCLKKENFIEFTKSKNLQDLILKLSNTSYKKLLLSPVETSEDLNELLDGYFKTIFFYFKSSIGNESKKNTQEYEIEQILNYIQTEYQINSFIYLLTSNKMINRYEFGFFETLNSFLYIKELKQILDLQNPFMDSLKQILKNNSLLKIDFGKTFREKNNLQKLSLILHKLNLDKFFESTHSELLREILNTEGDRMILEILFSARSAFVNTKDATVSLYNGPVPHYFPRCTNFSDYQIQQLCELNEAEITSIKNILEVPVVIEKNTKNICEAFHSTSLNYKISNFDDLIKRFDDIENRLFQNSFDEFEDTCCIYAYIKLREREIKNIKYIAACIEAERGGEAKKVFE